MRAAFLRVFRSLRVFAATQSLHRDSDCLRTSSAIANRNDDFSAVHVLLGAFCLPQTQNCSRLLFGALQSSLVSLWRASCPHRHFLLHLLPFIVFSYSVPQLECQPPLSLCIQTCRTQRREKSAPRTLDSHERPRELLSPCFLKELIPADLDSQCPRAGQSSRESGDHFVPVALQDFIS